MKKKLSKVNSSRRKNIRKYSKKGGKAKNGPYFSVDNFNPSYARFGSPGSSKLWRGGIFLNGGKKYIQKYKKKGGKSKNGPYFSVDNVNPSYARFGSPGASKIWRGGIFLN